MKSRTLLLAVCLLALLVAAGAPESTARPPAPSARSHFDWPQWRGPNRDDVSKETGLLKKWPTGGPKLLWKFDQAGVGYSDVAVVGDNLYTMGSDDRTEFLFALDLKTQKKVWNAEVGPLLVNGWGDGPRGTPTVDGDLIFAIGGQGNLVCVKAANGEKVWSRGLKSELGGEMMSGWGYTESPLVDGDQVVCTPGGSKGAVAAFNKKNGELLWRSIDFKDRAAYSSLVVAAVGGIHQYVLMTGESVAGIAAKDGKLLWRYARTGRTAAIPTPVVSGDLVYATSGYGAGCNLIRLTAAGSGIKEEEVYANKDMTNHHGGVVLVGDYLYGYSDSKGWECQDFKTGKVVWSERNKLGKGCLTYADGMLYLYAEKDGRVVLIEASPKGWNEQGRFTIPEQTKLKRKSGKIWTHPVVANGKLYLRDLDLIFCFDVKSGAAE
jgi:outer membrane protein assembly factor BamB